MYQIDYQYIITTPHIPRYRYFFNGQEADNEVYGEGAVLGYEFRQYDARIGRFWSVDPLAGKFPWNSVYAFAENMTIWARELEGLEAVVGISLGGDVNYRKPLLKSIHESAIVETIVAADKQGYPNEIEQLCGLLKRATTEDPEHTIGFVAIWGHGSYGVVYGYNGNPKGRMEISDLAYLKAAVDNGDIVFNKDACILITACNAGSDWEVDDGNGSTRITSFAQELADITGATVYAGRDVEGDGGVAPKTEKRGVEMTYQMRHYKKGSFFKFTKGNDPEDVGNVFNTMDGIIQGTKKNEESGTPEDDQ